MKKVMVVGLGPEYNYDKKDHSIWEKNNTKYASNHGASLISRTLIKIFNADYIDDFEGINRYRNEYDLCVLAFATHITSWRDVSRYTDFVIGLNIKTIAFSLGIQDYSSGSSHVHQLHSSMKTLMEYVISSSGYIGVRGPHTEFTLLKSGFKSRNIIRLGCPTLFNALNRNLQVNKKESFSKPLVVFHRTLADLNSNILSSAPLLGQDFLDEAVFTDDFDLNNSVRVSELKKFTLHKNGDFVLKQIKENGKFPNSFQEWFDEIRNYDFIIGARLHGCIAALIQGIPAVMIARDIRVIEIAEFYKIPYIKYENVGEMSIEDIYNYADFSAFNKLYKYRFDNFIKLLNDLKVLDRLEVDNLPAVPDSFFYNENDLSAKDEILYQELAQMQKHNSEYLLTLKRAEKLFSILQKIPGIKFINRMLR